MQISYENKFDLNDNEPVGATQFYIWFCIKTHFETKQKATWKWPIGLKNSHNFDIQSGLNFSLMFHMLHIGYIYLLCLLID